ncbi:ABC transporter ATP-binding protein [Mucilaginibacter sp. KACC 22063]|uniref:ABC transporter ATP-binding protein n=1 Tax=Mucilaginibacter sp. KACC 22063 TaxID=3025666 RepID=UPI002365293B|nr:ABC transporter ATP-binding protein [Mucilaginibacter sp. KACC 22063]WDF55783.1 ABC transporter ATP-binding protein [Mucilaginibacter sp. KACC 22063]
MLTLQQLRKSYGSHQALKGIDLKIASGEIYGLLGANGAGKSTAINILLGFTRPDGGRATLDGIDLLADPRKVSALVAYLPEVVQLYPLLSGLENLDFFSKLAGFNYSKDQLRDLLSRCGLQEQAHTQLIGSYSKGMRQKVGIAIALAKNAKLLVMDEPTSGLDPRAVEDFSIQVKAFADLGGAVLMATHDLFNAVAIGSRLGIMRLGEIIHTLDTAGISAADLQKLYLETI